MDRRQASKLELLTNDDLEIIWSVAKGLLSGNEMIAKYPHLTGPAVVATLNRFSRRWALNGPDSKNPPFGIRFTKDTTYKDAAARYEAAQYLKPVLARDVSRRRPRTRNKLQLSKRQMEE